MIHHTMIVAFDSPIPAGESYRYLEELGEPSPTPSCDCGLADLDATFTMPGALDLNKRRQSRRPYKAIWVNHEPLG
ncbi:hypothetical protein AB0896_06070 [Streptomyces parvulus]|uniref:hypothetical protein n=1 Tax=Streptomyces parvulus TaxID=146923 RepID=UPI0034530B14